LTITVCIAPCSCHCCCGPAVIGIDWQLNTQQLLHV